MPWVNSGCRLTVELLGDQRIGIEVRFQAEFGGRPEPSLAHRQPASMSAAWGVVRAGFSVEVRRPIVHQPPGRTVAVAAERRRRRRD